MNLEARLFKLEKQNRWLRLLAIAAIVLAVLPAMMGSRSDVEQIIKTRGIVLVAEDGSPRGAWGVVDDGKGSQLTLMTDEAGNGPSVSLRTDRESAVVRVSYDDDPKAFISWVDSSKDSARVYVKEGGQLKALRGN